MKAIDLPGPLFNAYMAGKYCYMRDEALDAARHAKTPQGRCSFAKAARRFNQTYLGLIRQARTA